jgi:hypothetical protein
MPSPEAMTQMKSRPSVYRPASVWGIAVGVLVLVVPGCFQEVPDETTDACAAVTCPASASPWMESQCDLAPGECALLVTDDGGFCDDGDPCAIGDSCLEGACLPSPKACADDVACTTDSCRAEDGVCVQDDAACGCLSDSNCDNADLCDGVEVCGADNTCVDGNAVVCEDSGDVCRPNACAPTTASVAWSTPLMR